MDGDSRCVGNLSQTEPLTSAYIQMGLYIHSNLLVLWLIRDLGWVGSSMSYQAHHKFDHQNDKTLGQPIQVLLMFQQM